MKFSKKFYFGASTSGHQVEGDNINDWSKWEEKNAERLARDAEKRFGKMPVWAEVKSEAQNPQNYISGKACDHYHRYQEDFDIAQSLGHGAHRFSIEWSRIEPEDGKWNENEIEHYRQVIKALRVRGMEPFVTLWHWTQPIWIADIGGWENKKTIGHFLRFVEKIVSEFKDEVKFWIVLNEPNIYTGFGFIKGSHPPGKKNVFKALKVYLNLLKTQKRAYKIIHDIDQDAQVGIANSFMYFEAQNKNIISGIIKNIADYFWNSWFVYKLGNNLDFIGCNYYTRHLIGIGEKKVKTGEVTDLGWEIFPQGIYLIIKKLSKYKKPIYITENGIADAKDEKRAKFIKDHLSFVEKAIEDGVDVRGYFYWSLLDNFEFPEVRGFWPRFGLVEVDFKTLERRIRQSARDYARIIKEATSN